jgi:hypothetical protein
MSWSVTLSLLAVSSWLLAFALAVGPVMNQQPTIFDLIQNDPDLSEVRIFNLYKLSFWFNSIAIDWCDSTIAYIKWRVCVCVIESI